MSTKAAKLARGLLRENRKNGRSWRCIAREDYGSHVNPTTLCRFAINKGEWIPKDEKIQVALGIKVERKHTPRQCLFDMATDTLRDALINRQPMPPIDPRILREFQKLGWIKKVRTR